MNLEKFTERSRGFVQSAQGLAQRSGHQRFTPEHLLKVLLEDKEGLAANLIRAAGGRPEQALAGVEAELAKQPRVEGGGAGQKCAAAEWAMHRKHLTLLKLSQGDPGGRAATGR